MRYTSPARGKNRWPRSRWPDWRACCQRRRSRFGDRDRPKLRLKAQEKRSKERKQKLASYSIYAPRQRPTQVFCLNVSLDENAISQVRTRKPASSSKFYELSRKGFFNPAVHRQKGSGRPGRPVAGQVKHG